MARKHTPWQGTCPKSGKRCFNDAHEAEKALGQARTRGYRRADREAGTRRGLHTVSRYYECVYCGYYHLTAQSTRENNRQMGLVG